MIPSGTILADEYDKTFAAQRDGLKRAQVRERAALEAQAWEMAAGAWQPYANEILPPAQGEEPVKAMRRIMRQVQCIAPRIVRTRVNGAVGAISIGADGDEQLTAELTALSLRRIIKRAAEQVVITGIAAFRAHTLPAEDGGGVVISRLGGYLEPVPDPYDVDRYKAVMQVWDGDGGKGYNVRIWDLAKPEFEEWRSASEPEKLRAGTGKVYPCEYPPRLILVEADGGGFQVGDIASGVNLIRAEYAAQFRAKRIEELFSFPVPLTRGAVELPKVWQPGAPVKTTEGGSFEFVNPKGLGDIFNAHDRLLNQIRDFFCLPGGVMGKGSFSGSPSGDALAEANLRYQQASSELAEELQLGAQAALDDYAAIRGIKKRLTIGITPNYERQKTQEVDMIRNLRKDRLIPPAVAVRAVQRFVPGFDAQEADAWAQALESVVSPESVLEALGSPAGDTNTQDPSQEA